MVRFKYRYLVVEVLANGKSLESISSYGIRSVVEGHVQDCFGDWGSGVALGNLSVKYFNPKTGILLLRAARSSFRVISTALTYIHQINGIPVVLNVFHIGGTIRSCREVVLRRQQDAIYSANEASIKAYSDLLEELRNEDM